MQINRQKLFIIKIIVITIFLHFFGCDNPELSIEVIKKERKENYFSIDISIKNLSEKTAIFNLAPSITASNGKEYFAEHSNLLIVPPQFKMTENPENTEVELVSFNTTNSPLVMKFSFVIPNQDTPIEFRLNSDMKAIDLKGK